MKLRSMNLQKRLISAVILDIIVTAFIFLLFANSPDRNIVVFSSFVLLQLVPLFFLMKDFIVKIVLFRLEKEELHKHFLSILERYDFPAPDKKDQKIEQYLHNVAGTADDNKDAAIEAARLEGYFQAVTDLGNAQLYGHLGRGILGAMNEYYASKNDE